MAFSKARRERRGVAHNSNDRQPDCAVDGAPDARPTTSHVASSRPLDPSVLHYLLTVDEVAALLRTTRKAIYAQVERAQLPGIVRVGRRVLVRRDDLLEFIDGKTSDIAGSNRR